jgi:hypothetical protein
MFKSWEPNQRTKTFLAKAKKKDLVTRTARYPNLKEPFIAKIAQPGYELTEFDQKVVEKIRWIEKRREASQKIREASQKITQG